MSWLAIGVWSLICLGMIAVTVGSIRGRASVVTVALHLLLLASWLVVGAVAIFEAVSTDVVPEEALWALLVVLLGVKLLEQTWTDDEGA